MSTSSQVKDALEALGAPESVYAKWLDEPRLDDSGSQSLKGAFDLRREDLAPNLFDYQSELVEKIQLATRGDGPSLVSLPTGGGKTRTAVAAALSALREDRSSRWLWIAPTIELLHQAAETLRLMWAQDASVPDCRFAFQGPPDPNAFVWFNTPQSLNSSELSVGRYSVVVFDEAHQLGARTFRSAVEQSLSPSSALIGLSATPGRANDAETAFLVNYFEGNLIRSDILGSNPVQSLIDRGVLAQFSFRRIVQDGAALDSKDRLTAICRLAKRLVSNGRQVLAFASTVGEAIAASAYLQHLGVSADYVEAQLGLEERRARLSAFESGETRILFNQRLLATGYDCPAVSDVVLGSRIGSPVLFEQMVGRAARGPLTGGSSVARIWEFDDHLSIHGLPQSYYRFRDFEWQQT